MAWPGYPANALLISRLLCITQSLDVACLVRGVLKVLCTSYSCAFVCSSVFKFFWQLQPHDPFSEVSNIDSNKVEKRGFFWNRDQPGSSTVHGGREAGAEVAGGEAGSGERLAAGRVG